MSVPDFQTLRGMPDRGTVVGKSGDGGIDGTIREDALALDEVYVQAKKYSEDQTVGEPALRDFAGAIDAAATNKGEFVTTASFTKAARDYVARSSKSIVLIDGEDLARLMVAHDIGVRTRDTIKIKRIDEDFFSEE
ncbi:MAG: restriction endonuclease [Gammaproteobacteria bacterium]|nr:restriction endonuclease [Gammaproteobacteria bacterium]